MVYKAFDIFYLALYRRSLPTSVSLLLYAPMTLHSLYGRVSFTLLMFCVPSFLVGKLLESRNISVLLTIEHPGCHRVK